MTTNDNRTVTADGEAPVHREHDDQSVRPQPVPVEPVYAEPVSVEPVPTERALKKELNQLWHTLEARPVIGLARSIVMTLGGCTHEEAFQVLVDVSRHTNIELREIAQRLVDSVDGPPPSGPLRTALQSAFERLRANTAWAPASVCGCQAGQPPGQQSLFR